MLDSACDRAHKNTAITWGSLKIWGKNTNESYTLEIDGHHYWYELFPIGLTLACHRKTIDRFHNFCNWIFAKLDPDLWSYSALLILSTSLFFRTAKLTACIPNTQLFRDCRPNLCANLIQWFCEMSKPTWFSLLAIFHRKKFSVQKKTRKIKFCPQKA